ncbi:MAG: hypothetical protein M3281_05825 [Chloroflexota bacterium]|nr:hypothetical protein [Chloroflexota bacterium]
MIFVTVGTFHFEGLVQRMDELATGLDEQVICQIASGTYVPKNCEYFRFAPSLDSYMERARLVITHGGLVVVEAVRMGKPVVAIANPNRTDRHPHQILSVLEQHNHIVWCRTLDDLPASIARASTMTFAPYTEPPCHIHTVIRDFLRREPSTMRSRLSQRLRP